MSQLIKQKKELQNLFYVTMALQFASSWHLAELFICPLHWFELKCEFLLWIIISAWICRFVGVIPHIHKSLIGKKGVPGEGHWAVQCAYTSALM